MIAPNLTLTDEQRKLVEEHKALVYHLTKGYRGDKETRDEQHFMYEDLVAAGFVGLARAAATYDPSKGTKFITYAYSWVKGAISRTAKKEDSRKSKEVPIKAEHLEQNPRFTTRQKLGTFSEKPSFSYERSGPMTMSRFPSQQGPGVANWGDQNDNTGIGGEARSYGAWQINADMIDAREILPGEVVELVDAAALTERQRRFVEMKFGLNGTGSDGLTQQAIAEQEGVSEATVSTDLAEAMRKLERVVDERLTSSTDGGVIEPWYGCGAPRPPFEDEVLARIDAGRGYEEIDVSEPLRVVAPSEWPTSRRRFWSEASFLHGGS